MELNKEIFRAYDIRGIVDETLTDDIVEQIGKAIGTKVLSAQSEKQVIVARDGRISGNRFSEKLISGLKSTGCNVVNIGMVPTPVLYFATKFLNINSAIMITGSHNPTNYNGFKIIINNKSLYGDEIQEICQKILNQEFSTGNGSQTEKDIHKDYIKFCKDSVKVKKKLKIAIDCGNGVTGCIAEKLFAEFDCEIIPLYTEVDGNFPNHHPDPGKPENLKELQESVLEHKTDLGIAFDGDGDRLGIVDEKGQIICADRALILFAKQYKSPTVIYDVKCTNNVHKVVEEIGGNPIMWKTGHSLIKAKMKEVDADIAGEMSGHIFFKENHGFDDALFAGLKLLEIYANSNLTSFSDLFKDIPDSFCTPEITVESTETEKFAVIEKFKKQAKFDDAVNISTVDGLRVDFEDGWGLIRASNTSPNIVMRFEANDSKRLEEIKSKFLLFL